MTEPVFKAPLPPQEGETVSSSSQMSEGQKKGVGAEDIKQQIASYLWYVLAGVFVVGLIFGTMMSGGNPEPVRQGCPVRIVDNPDIQGQFPLCGRTSRAEPCVMYVMNTTQYDRSGEDFYSEVQRLTERPVQLIAIENPVYSKYRIPPGAFARIKVPSLR